MLEYPRFESRFTVLEPRFQTASKGMIMTDRNETLFNRAKAIIPGGVWVLTAPDGGAEGLAPYGIEPKALG